ncbi:MAG: hypothetical protein LBH39_00485 [Clostridiales Family XIII bacterium]|jgi:hypothetical protein|nr:hypothetical protein [Clostridiales Family XIII bacterium]
MKANRYPALSVILAIFAATGMLFGSADCVASYIHHAPDGSVSIWKGK